ncbi:TorF family putative porin [Erythrobacter crassostreae]|uniref:TorF family putative porin n=1 Tax=Erythrobacter crassostreae TaxID=2828328 RepID=A0A9X1F488_9SPHN|nr:TorF family putative porin [Erythrobacter crassostrea]MBV7259198.1 TorF family putative porin [Erythrobacter crassostrea]
MLTSIRGLTAATLSAGILLSAAPALASDTVSDEANTLIEPSDVEFSDELLAAAAELDVAETGLVLTPATERASAPIAEGEISNIQGGEDASSPLTFSANVAFAIEYRFRGVALTDGNFAVQGGFDLAHDSGLYVGTWASNLDEQTVGYGSTEVDLYGGWSGDLTDGISADVGGIFYLYPDAGTGDFDYYEFYGSLSFGLGPASVTGGVAYAPDQDSLGGTDNLYIYGDVSFGIPDTPITLNGHVGYTDGFLTFTTDSEAIDWSVSADLAVGPVTFSAAYVGVEGDVLVDPTGTFTDDAFVATVSASF